MLSKNAKKTANKAKRKSGAAPDEEAEGEVDNSEADSSARSGLPISMT